MMMTKLFDIIKNHKLRKIILGCFSVMILMSISSNVVAEEKLPETPLYTAGSKYIPTDQQIEAAWKNGMELNYGLPVVALVKKIGTGQSVADTYVEQIDRNNLRTIKADKKVSAYRMNITNQIWRNASNKYPENEEAALAEFEKAKKVFDEKIDELYYSQMSSKSVAESSKAKEKALQEIYGKLDKFYADVKENIEKNGMNQTAAIENAAKDEVEVIASEIQGCPTIEQLKQKYQAGCWSCLVVEKLVSSFLNAASKAYEVSQRAGLIVLAIGSVMWVLMWGLKNMSSFTQLEPGNILNDLIKFAFKILLAYVFITSGLKAISSYFINPIMGTGAVIAQQFWPDVVVAETEAYNWDYVETEESLAVIIEKDIKANKEEIERNQTTTLVTTPEEQALYEQAKKLELKENEKSEIPSFITPGVPGKISGYPGCRIKFVTGYEVIKGKKEPIYSSSSHMGLDVSQNNMAVIKAIAGGKIIFAGDAGKTSWGLRATITTKHKGNTWIHLYGHMNPKTYYDLKSKLNGREVVQGEQIGNVGNTGASSGPHLHLEVHLTGKVGQYNYKDARLEPISLGQGKIVPRNPTYNAATKTFSFNKDRCDGKTMVDPAPNTGYPKGAYLPEQGFSSSGKAGLDLQATYTTTGSGADGGSGDYSSLVLEPLGDIKYTGKTDILSKSVMNSILGATKVITSTMAETMVLGNAITCFSTQKNGGAWKFDGGWKTLWTDFYITNFWMWIEGAAIWCCGFMLTLAVAYYLLDICFKLGFAVIALPIVMGLWPFNMTKGKFMICISIMFKSAATFAFLAITTSYAMNMISSVLAGNDGGDGLTKMYEALEIGAEANKENIRFVSDRMAIFGSYFIMLLFAFIYSFKLIGATVPQFVDKFFPDNAFGGASPMHHMATMATKYLKDKAMAPAGLARDVAMHQTGKLAKGAIKGAAVFATGKGSGGTAAGNAVKGVGKGVAAAGRGISAISKAASAIPVAGQAIAAVGNVAGKAVEAAGKATQAVGGAVNKVNTRNNKPKDKKDESKK